MAEKVDRRPTLQVLKHVDIGHNHTGNKVVVAVETDRGPVVLMMTTEVLAEHIRQCTDLMDMVDDATLDRKPHSSRR